MLGKFLEKDPSKIPSSINADNLSLIHSAIYPNNFPELHTEISPKTLTGIFPGKSLEGFLQKFSPFFLGNFSKNYSRKTSPWDPLKIVPEISSGIPRRFPRVSIKRLPQDFFWGFSKESSRDKARIPQRILQEILLEITPRIFFFKQYYRGFSIFFLIWIIQGSLGRIKVRIS